MKQVDIKSNKMIHRFGLVLFIFLLNSPRLFSQANTWTWMHGSNIHYANAIYGTQGQAAPANVPISMYESANWTDQNGRFWIMGGVNGGAYEHAELWMFDPATNMWTWKKGNAGPNAIGIYGVQGVASPVNFPGSRGWGVITWADSLGNLWLYGGYGFDINGQYGPLADLWKYSIAANEWTWMSGNPVIYYGGNYGTILVPDSANAPPAKHECIANWVDDNGNFWMYGGLFVTANSYNDMWKYDPSTNIWTWMSGNAGAGSVAANYGTLQVPASTNNPGGRASASSWKDQNGRFWMYGGLIVFPGPTYGDMWMFDPATNLWTWMAGGNYWEPANTFTVQNIAGNGNPGARYEAKSTWTDDCGRFWSYGGFTNPGGNGAVPWNDLWMFDPATNLFTWKNGLNVPGAYGNYGTIQIPAASNYPDGTGGASAFKDSLDNFWMFGGWAWLDPYGSTNSLWRYEPAPDSCNLTLHVSEANTNAFIAYPNPGNGTVYVQLSEKMPIDGLTIQVFDAAGRCVETKTNLLSHLVEINPEAAGMYCIMLSDASGNIIGSARIIHNN